MGGLTHVFCAIDWGKVVNVFSALLTPVIAGVTTYIALQQYKTNKNQFRLALFDKRLEVFNAAGELIGTVLSRARADNDDLRKFLWETRQNEFLFGSDIAAYFHEIYSKASDVYSLEGATDEGSIQQKAAALIWFSGKGDEIKKKFGTYMAFKE